MSLKLVFNNNDTLFECPIYDEKNNFLYFVSIIQNKIYQLNIATNIINTYNTTSNVGCIALLNETEILEAEADGIFKLNVKNKQKTLMTHIITDKNLRYNDGKLDSCGRFLVGTKGISDDYEGLGALYSVNMTTNKVKTLVPDTKISNGLAFSHDDEYLYFTDTSTQKIGKYLYNIKTGETNFIEYIFDTKNLGYPDGMCIDKDGNLWVALWQGHSIININPNTKRLIRTIKLPCANVTSCCIVNEYLYITTAASNSDSSGSCLFRINI